MKAAPTKSLTAPHTSTRTHTGSKIQKLCSQISKKVDNKRSNTAKIQEYKKRLRQCNQPFNLLLFKLLPLNMKAAILKAKAQTIDVCKVRVSYFCLLHDYVNYYSRKLHSAYKKIYICRYELNIEI